MGTTAASELFCRAQTKQRSWPSVNVKQTWQTSGPGRGPSMKFPYSSVSSATVGIVAASGDEGAGRGQALDERRDLLRRADHPRARSGGELPGPLLLEERFEQEHR